MSTAEVMAFESIDEADAALDAIGIIAIRDSSGRWDATVKVPEDLESLEATLLNEDAPESAKILAGTLIALAPDRAVDGVFSFSVRVPQDQAAGATQNGE